MSQRPATPPMRVVVLGLRLSSSWGNGHATTYRDEGRVPREVLVPGACGVRIIGLKFNILDKFSRHGRL